MKHSIEVLVALLAWAGAASAQEPAPAAPAAPAPAAPAAPAAEAPAEPAAPAPAPAPAPEPPPAAAPPSAEPPPASPAPPLPAPAAEEDLLVPPPAEPAPAPVEPEKPLLGLGVGTPDTGTLPGRFRPSYGVEPVTRGDYRFDFHGYLAVPLRFGMNQRKDPYSTQYGTVLHGPPVVPGDHETFEHTGVLPEPWVQMAFSYGNPSAVATIIVAARNVSAASGFYDPPNQLGINDAFITFKPDLCGLDLSFDVGGFSDRYGAMGEYDLGRYDTPVIARVGGVGETARLSVPIGPDLVFLAEHGIMAQFDRAQLGVEPAGWNGFADPNVGTSFANHAHLGLALPGRGQVGLHYVGAFTRDDRTAPTLPDGTLSVYGLDVSAGLAPFGRLYAAAGYTDASTARGVSSVVRVLNAPGGKGLMDEYFGPDSGGTGTLMTVGAQYDVSIGEIVRSPQPYSGYGPDLFVSAFGLMTQVGSDDDAYDGVTKLKYGTEITYSALSWLAVSGRYDRVVSDTDDDSQTFAVISPRVIFRTDFNSQDQVTLQYSRWFYGSGTVVRTGYPPRDNPAVYPDEDTFMLMANMWW